RHRAAHAGLEIHTHRQTPTGFHKLVLLAVTAIALSGCTMVTGRLSSETYKQVAQADVIELETAGRKIELSDPESVERFQNAVSSAKWSPYRGFTCPGWIGDCAIQMRRGDEVLCSFGYDGGLWAGSYTKLRTANLIDADQEWLDSLFLNDTRDEYRELAGGDNCPVHGDRLSEFGFSASRTKSASLCFPHPDGFTADSKAEFPFAKPWATESGYVQTELILFCPECEERKQLWLRSHGHE
ncbi:MAG: hypothetical protein AB8G99_10095, partial [Planctomycetaceae bacterium]